MSRPVSDVAVVGAGVVGAAIAAELARRELRVLWLESAHDVCEGASKANSGIACSGYDIAPDTLESALVRASSPRWESICGALDVPFARVGALALAFGDEDLDGLGRLASQAAAAEVDAEVVEGPRLRALLAGQAPAARRALHVPGEGIVDPIRLTLGWASLAVRNGAELRRSSPVRGFRRDPGGLISHVETGSEALEVRAVVNAAGVRADEVSRSAGAEELISWPRKGQFLLLDRALGERVPRILATIPAEHGRGVLAVPTTNRSVLLGPTAVDGSDREDTATDADTFERLLSDARRLVPGADRAHLIKTFAGLRPAGEPTYRIERSRLVPNLVHVAGIRSTGVSSAPAVAELVCRLLGDAGVEAPVRARAVARLPRVNRLAELPSDHIDAVADPEARSVVCACEHVTVAEIRAACGGPVPATSLAGVRKRTRAMAGRCQGACCQADVGAILAAERGYVPSQVPFGEPGSEWGVDGG